MFSTPLIYIQVHAGHLFARRIGGPGIRVACETLNHPRTLMGDFMAVEACFKSVLKEQRVGGAFALSPAVVVHLVPEAAGGYTNVEERAFQEAAVAAGARSCRVVTGGQVFSDAEVAGACR